MSTFVGKIINMILTVAMLFLRDCKLSPHKSEDHHCTLFLRLYKNNFSVSMSHLVVAEISSAFLFYGNEQIGFTSSKASPSHQLTLRMMEELTVASWQAIPSAIDFRRPTSVRTTEEGGIEENDTKEDALNVQNL